MKHSQTFSTLVRKFPSRVRRPQQPSSPFGGAGQHRPAAGDEAGLSSFFFPSRLRDDTWVELNHLSAPLLKGDQPDDHLIREIQSRLDLLAHVEVFTIYIYIYFVTIFGLIFNLANSLSLFSNNLCTEHTYNKE